MDTVQVTCDLCGSQFWIPRWQYETDLNFPEDDTVCPSCACIPLAVGIMLAICENCSNVRGCYPRDCHKFQRYAREIASNQADDNANH